MRVDSNEFVCNQLIIRIRSYDLVSPQGIIKITNNMPPRNSAIILPLLDGMGKIEAFCCDVVAIVRKASEMTRGLTRVSPHEFSRILRSINEK
jgi:hypothetical protein